MPNDPLGISFSPFGSGSGDPGRPTGGPSGPQDAIRVLSLRTPRTVGAASPIPGGLLNSPGGGGFGGGNLEQLLALLFGNKRLMGGVTGLPEPPQPQGGAFPGMTSFFPGTPEAPQPRTPTPSFIPGQDRPEIPQPKDAGLPWETPSAPDRSLFDREPRLGGKL